MRHPEGLRLLFFFPRCSFGDDVLFAKERHCTLVGNTQFSIMNEDHERIEMDLVCNSLQCTNIQQFCLFFSVGRHFVVFKHFPGLGISQTLWVIKEHC